MRDALDTAILKELRHNGRISLTELSHKLSRPRSTIHERISRLEASGVILGYTVRLAEAEVQPRVEVLIMLEVRQQDTRKVLSRIKDFPEVERCLSINGEYDLFVSASAPSIEDLDILVDELGVLPGVVRTHTSVVFGAKIDRTKSS